MTPSAIITGIYQGPNLAWDEGKKERDCQANKSVNFLMVHNSLTSGNYICLKIWILRSLDILLWGPKTILWSPTARRSSKLQRKWNDFEDFLWKGYYVVMLVKVSIMMSLCRMIAPRSLCKLQIERAKCCMRLTWEALLCNEDMVHHLTISLAWCVSECEVG